MQSRKKSSVCGCGVSPTQPLTKLQRETERQRVRQRLREKTERKTERDGENARADFSEGDKGTGGSRWEDQIG